MFGYIKKYFYLCIVNKDGLAARLGEYTPTRPYKKIIQFVAFYNIVYAQKDKKLPYLLSRVIPVYRLALYASITDSNSATASFAERALRP